MSKYTDDFLILQLKTFYDKFHATPISNKFHISANTYRRHFGTWNKALMVANIPINTPWKIETTYANCKQCGDTIEYTSEIKKFCSRSCAAKYNNTGRLVSDITKEKMSRSAISNNSNRFRIINPNVTGFTKNYFKKSIVGDYSPLFTCKCRHCNNIFVSRKVFGYCVKHIHLYGENNYNRFRFTFSLRQYPDLFDHMSQHLREIGMRSPTNNNGLTRDHRVSVNEAIRNDYDPYYIRHPLNCELMTWIDNIHKYTKSSLSYEKLKQLVDDYEKLL